MLQSSNTNEVIAKKFMNYETNVYTFFKIILDSHLDAVKVMKVA